jgi:hypothetical protein
MPWQEEKEALARQKEEENRLIQGGDRYAVLGCVLWRNMTLCDMPACSCFKPCVCYVHIAFDVHKVVCLRFV